MDNCQGGGTIISVSRLVRGAPRLPKGFPGKWFDNSPRILGQRHDAEDAAQTTLMLFSRKAVSIKFSGEV
jgi:hypothetical protein